MMYVDMHCDALSAALGGATDLQVTPRKLKSGDCLAQCFAIFTNGESAAGDFNSLAALYRKMLKENGDLVAAQTVQDVLTAHKQGKVAAILTVENCGFLGENGDLSPLKALGVKMLSLVWNDENSFGYPNLAFVGGVPDFAKRNGAGLKELGKRAVEQANQLKIILDVSHLSDGGVEDALEISSAPIVASHSNCHSVCPISRNLTDGQLKKIADKGGVIGLNVCRDFLTVQQDGFDAFALLLAHYKHLVNVAGEQAAAFGSDFDGIPPYPQIKDCLAVQDVLNYFSMHGVPSRQIENFAYKNFLRVFGQVCG